MIARYYPNNENSIREFGEIYYNMIDLGWSGTVDIWTYDERHFIGFNILEGELTSTVRYDTGIEENAKLINGHNYLTVDCYRITTTVTYTYTTTGYYETTIVATQNYATICSGGGSASPGYGNDSGTYYDYGGTYGYGGSGSYGAVEEQTYAPPIITSPTIKVEKEEEQILICPDSFSFHLKGSNWRAAGLKDFNFTIMDLQKNKVNTIIFSYEVGFPINTADGRYFSEAFVRNIAEIAHNQAEAYIGANYTLDFFEPGAHVKYGNKFVRKMEEIIRKKLNHNGAIVNFGLITISDNEAKQPVYKGIFGCD